MLIRFLIVGLNRTSRAARPSLPCFNECTVDPQYHSLSRFEDNTGIIDLLRESLIQCVFRQRAFGCVSWHDLDRQFPVAARPGAPQPDGKEVALRVWLANAGVRDLPARATVSIPERQSNVGFRPHAQKTSGKIRCLTFSKSGRTTWSTLGSGPRPGIRARLSDGFRACPLIAVYDGAR